MINCVLRARFECELSTTILNWEYDTIQLFKFICSSNPTSSYWNLPFKIREKVSAKLIDWFLGSNKWPSELPKKKRVNFLFLLRTEFQILTYSHPYWCQWQASIECSLWPQPSKMCHHRPPWAHNSTSLCPRTCNCSVVWRESQCDSPLGFWWFSPMISCVCCDVQWDARNWSLFESISLWVQCRSNADFLISQIHNELFYSKSEFWKNRSLWVCECDSSVGCDDAIVYVVACKSKVVVEERASSVIFYLLFDPICTLKLTKIGSWSFYVVDSSKTRNEK